MKKKFVTADIHGNIKGLVQALQRANFNYEEDRLIVLGDTCDGWAYVRECFDELLKIKDLIYVLGNHDFWALQWFVRSEYGVHPHDVPDTLWTSQGGANTLKSYSDVTTDGRMFKEHLELLRNAYTYYVEDNNIFVHGGFSEIIPVEVQPMDYLMWDRDLFGRAVMVHGCNPDYKIQDWNIVFVGHTTVEWTHKRQGRHTIEEYTKPIFACNLINLDTGAGYGGKVTVMNVNTKEYWQSDTGEEMYPNEKGRY